MDGRMHPSQANRGRRLRLLVASDVRFVRESLGEILGKSDTISVVGHCGGADQVLTQSRALDPDMVLLDAAAHDGLSTVRQIRAWSANMLVVVFALIESVEAVLAWTEAGASGYISSTAATAEIAAMIAEISAGRQACSATVVASLLRRVAATAAPPRPLESDPQALTRREVEIVRLVSTGLSNKEIARNLRISLATTKSHVHSALCKLRVQRRGQIATWMYTRSAEP
jgi:two-component system nitrate/nitrite response regulator NarL